MSFELSSLSNQDQIYLKDHLEYYMSGGIHGDFLKKTKNYVQDLSYVIYGNTNIPKQYLPFFDTTFNLEQSNKTIPVIIKKCAQKVWFDAKRIAMYIEERNKTNSLVPDINVFIFKLNISKGSGKAALVECIYVLSLERIIEYFEISTKKAQGILRMFSNFSKNSNLKMDLSLNIKEIEDLCFLTVKTRTQDYTEIMKRYSSSSSSA